MRRSLPPLLVAVACAAAACVVWLVAMRTDWGAWIDARTLAGFAGLDRPRIAPAADRLEGLVDPDGFALLAAVVVGAAVVRGRIRLACVVALVLLAANVTTQGLKRALPDVETGFVLGPGPGAWPSGHATAVMVLVLCAVLVAPARVRAFVAAGGGLVSIAVVYSLLILQRHHPSDIVGGYLIAAAWTALGVAVLNATGGRSRAADEDRGAPARPSAVAAAFAATVVLGFALTRPDAALEYAEQYTVFVAGALALGVAALGAATLTAVAARDG